MTLTRRDFLSSASRSAAWIVASRALAGCRGSPDAKSPQPTISPRAGRKLIRPPKGQVLFIAGQGARQLGGLPAEGMADGYLDHIQRRPGGFSLYCSIAEGPLDTASLDQVCDLAALKDSVLHLSVGWVADFDLSTKENNKAITTGAFDQNINRLAQWCAAQPRPILLRIGFEFDRGLPIPAFHYDPAYFVQGFRRIVDHLGAAGASNVSTVLASTNAPPVSPVLTTETFHRFYPGDDYVDWLGCSMWVPTAIDHVILNEARRRGKPVLLAETTPAGYEIGKNICYPFYFGLMKTVTPQEIWDGWHQPMIDFIQANSDVIAGWHYIAADWSVEPPWNAITNCDSRPWGTAQFLEIWNNHMNSTPFLQTSANLFRDLGASSIHLTPFAQSVSSQSRRSTPLRSS